MGNREIQKIGEDAAAAFLSNGGFRVLVRNWRVKMGELDLVAMDGDTIVFVEVKARLTGQFTDPALAVDYLKQRRLRRLASLFLAQSPPPFKGCRFDVISVITGQRPPVISHLRNAFS